MTYEKDVKGIVILCGLPFCPCANFSFCAFIGEIKRYLMAWKKETQARSAGDGSLKRPGWKFQKLKQSLVIDNLYNEEFMDKKSFKIALLYLQGLKGAARPRIMEAAAAIKANKPCDVTAKACITDVEDDDSTKESKEESASRLKHAYRRAKKIIIALSTES